MRVMSRQLHAVISMSEAWCRHSDQSAAGDHWCCMFPCAARACNRQGAHGPALLAAPVSVRASAAAVVGRGVAAAARRVAACGAALLAGSAAPVLALPEAAPVLALPGAAPLLLEGPVLLAALLPCAACAARICGTSSTI